MASQSSPLEARMRFGGSLRTWATLVAGAVGGAAASFALSQLRAGAAEAESRVHPVVLAASSATSDPLLPSLLAEHQALRSRVAQLEAHAAASAAPSATSAESSPAREPNPDPEAHRAELRAERDASEKAHSEEARDP